MRGLVARIALIFILSMFSVLLIATAVTWFVLSRGDSERAAAPMARHIASTSDMLLGKPPQEKVKRGFFPRRIPPGEIVTSLPEGQVQQDPSRALQGALAREGETRPVSVIDTGSG